MALGDFVDKAKNMAKNAFGDTASDDEGGKEDVGNVTDRAATSKEMAQNRGHAMASMDDAANNTGDATLNSGGQQPSAQSNR
jgi:hypothetical protein